MSEPIPSDPHPNEPRPTEHDPRSLQGLLARRRWLRTDSPRARWRNHLTGIFLVFVGLLVALANGANPVYQSTILSPSGYFFALADDGSTLFAASENDGSVLLEQSTDQGLTWTSSPVPYSVVAGGAPWDLASVATDGSNILLAAASDGTPQYEYGGDVPTPGCGTNSSLLLAASSNEGLTWNTEILGLPQLAVSSLQVGILGSAAAVAWLALPSLCPGGQEVAQAVTSGNAGASWGAIQNLSGNAGPSSTASQIEMASEGETGSPSLLIAYEQSPTSGSSSSHLVMWDDPTSPGTAFLPYLSIPAPTSWTLQGSSDTPAFLITPSYLIPITGVTASSLTALPFGELQVDGGGVGELPGVVSLIPTGTTSVEIAAAMADGSGVDCWDLDYAHGTVSQSCHVPLGSLVAPSGSEPPIVALLDGGGWWVAIGAGGQTCWAGCGDLDLDPFGGGLVAGSHSTSGPASPAVATSECHFGCGAANGLTAYSYSPSSSLGSAAVSAFAGLLVIVGGALMGSSLVTRWKRRGSGSSVASSEPAPSPNEPTTVISAYRRGLLLWALGWVALAALAFSASSSASFSDAPYLIVTVAVLATIGGFFFQSSARQALQRAHALRPEDYFTGRSLGASRGGGEERVRVASFYAYLSWGLGFVLVIYLLLVLSGGIGLTTQPVYGPAMAAPQLSEGAFFLVGLIGGVALLRSASHYEMAAALRAVRRDLGIAELPPAQARNAKRRDGLAAILLPWNPFTGLLVGLALQPVYPGAVLALAWVCLPITLLGLALVGGFLGRSAWTLGDPAASA
jgi:hypothetical protein